MVRRFVLLSGAAALIMAWGCSSLKDATPATPPDAATPAVDATDPSDGSDPRDASDAGEATAKDAQTTPDDASVVDPASVGAGPFGALPSGYCCASDADCRNRHCELVNGTKMCLDFCLSNDDCTGIATGFHCAFNQDGYGFCEPSPSITTCASASLYHHGTKPLGACCQLLADGRMGTECLGGSCTQNGSQNPYVCSQDCTQTGSCPPKFTCGHADSFGLRYECLPVAFNYTCSP